MHKLSDFLMIKNVIKIEKYDELKNIRAYGWKDLFN